MALLIASVVMLSAASIFPSITDFRVAERSASEISLFLAREPSSDASVYFASSCFTLSACACN